MLKANWPRDLVQDIRYGARALRQSPGFTVVAVLTLALGIGANTAIFSVVEAVLLRPLPFQDPDRLVVLTEYNPRKVDTAGVPYPDYIEWKKHNTVFTETAAYFDIDASNDVVLGLPEAAERVEFSMVTNSFFSILGVQPAQGRGFAAGEEQAGAGKVFLASDALWRGGFGADPNAIGKTFLVDGAPFTLVGVMPRGFQFPLGRDVWLPAGAMNERQVHDRVSHPFRVLGRLRAGVGLARAQAELDGMERRLGQAYPATNANWRVRVRPLLDEFVGNSRASLLVLLGAVTFILLIACANTVNLMLARASAREQEFAVRAALGAGRSRLVRQSLAESLFVVLLSVAAAVPLAAWGLTAILSLTAARIARLESFHLDTPVFVFTLLIALATTAMVGLAPALQLSASELQGSLRQWSGRRGRRFRDALVVAEVALAVVLLCGAGLMLRSFVRLNLADPGFNTAHLVTMKIALPDAQYTRAEQTAAFLDRLLERLNALPGVEAAATTTLPLSGESNWGSFNIAGQPLVDRSQALSAEGRGVSANYFRVMGVALLRGRDFNARDGQDVAIVNQAMARRFFPNVDPIGQHLLGFDAAPPREIVGVVADTKSFGLDAESKPEIYTPYRGWWYMNLALRTTQDPAALVPAVRRQVAALDKGVPVYRVATMDQLLSRSIAPQRFNLFLLGLFAALALVLAAVGIEGLMAFAVNRRQREIGIRVALGARPSNILGLMVGQGMRLVLGGLLLGVAASSVLTRLMSTLLYGVGATDPATFGGVAMLLAAVAFVACYIPARRAARVDPLAALRSE